MSSNSFGKHFRMTSFGESHGAALGVVIDGCPSGVSFSENTVTDFLQRRRPGQSVATSGRREMDDVKILSGVFEGKTLGTPLAMMVENHDARSADYDQIKGKARPGHADDVWLKKFGHSDHRGGGRSSGRETISRVMAGAVAKMFLQEHYKELCVWSAPRSVGDLYFETSEFDQNGVYGLSGAAWKRLENFLAQAKGEGESYGGVAELNIVSVPASLGQPVFRKLKSDLAAALMGVGAVVGFEYGAGFSAASEKGTDFHKTGQGVYGGIRGGVSTGEDIQLRVVFKPTASVMDVAKKGRHDPCVLLRALVVLEAMVWLVLADHELWRRLDRCWD